MTDTGSDYNDQAERRLLAALNGFGMGETAGRAEVTAAVEVLLEKWREDRAGYPLDEFIAVKNCGKELAAVLNDPQTALAEHDQAIRADYTDEIADLTTQRDRARATAVRLEQELAELTWPHDLDWPDDGVSDV